MTPCDCQSAYYTEPVPLPPPSSPTERHVDIRSNKHQLCTLGIDAKYLKTSPSSSLNVRLTLAIFICIIYTNIARGRVRLTAGMLN